MSANTQPDPDVAMAKSEGYIHRVLVALDMFGNVICGGDVDETISARSARAAARGDWLGRFMVWWLDKVQPNHGELAEEGDLGRAEIVAATEADALKDDKKQAGKNDTNK